MLIGTSGWNYPHWSEGVFYPSSVRREAWLAYYARRFGTVEVNNTFYRLPESGTFLRWRASTPERFCFAVKASRFITHMKKLREPERALERFLRAVSGLGDKLGPVLFQLPPFWRVNPERLRSFVTWVRSQDMLLGLRAAFEFRNTTWLCDGVIEILREHNLALCLADWPDLNVAGPITADFVYVRRHGSTVPYASPYGEEELRRDAASIEGWLDAGRDVYVYFNNDAYGWAVKNAEELMELMEKA